MGDGLESDFRQFGGSVADDLAERTIDADEMPIEPNERHPDRRLIDSEPESLLRFLQCPFDALALADVAHESLPPAVRQDVGAYFDGHEGSVLPLLSPLGSVDLSRNEKFGPDRLQPCRIFERNDIENCFAKQFVPIVAEQPACGLVYVREAGFEIRLKEGVGR